MRWLVVVLASTLSAVRALPPLPTGFHVDNASITGAFG
jgi:hypothetical protein